MKFRPGQAEFGALVCNEIVSEVISSTQGREKASRDS